MQHASKSDIFSSAVLHQVPVPAGLDVLLVEQEVVGTEQSALEVHLSCSCFTSY